MTTTKALKALLLAALLFTLPSYANLNEKRQLSALTQNDKQFLGLQRQNIDNLARRYLGQQLKGEAANDLVLLQALLNQSLVTAQDKLNLQAMGVVLGDLLADELDMHWIILEDKYGRSRALQLEQTENFLFPVTMISRRAEVGANVSVNAIFEKAKAIIEPYRVKGPFQYD